MKKKRWLKVIKKKRPVERGVSPFFLPLICANKKGKNIFSALFI